MKVLVLNCGSSTLKFQVVDAGGSSGSGKDCHKLARGIVERIGGDSCATFQALGGGAVRENTPMKDHAQAVHRLMRWLSEEPEIDRFEAVGHRVVHGGDLFTSPVLIDDGVTAGLERLIPLAPLHNPAALSGIRAARAILGTAVPMVAVFDTSFHQSLPPYAATYAIPYELTERYRIRRWGFHGLAHRYAALRYSEITASPLERNRIVTLHLGNGCSATAILGGYSVDTSMGFTPLEGLVMGTRSGDLDPAIVGYLAANEKVTIIEVESWLNHRSGLLGISGVSNDMRKLVEQADHNPRARLALDIFCYRARKYLGAYITALGGADAVVFSGGIGENQPLIRKKICTAMEWCGLVVEEALNDATAGREACISAPGARIHAYVIPTDEEALIARDTADLIDRPAVTSP
jgi:acetate kinase